jgi:hypothetical protein
MAEYTHYFFIRLSWESPLRLAGRRLRADLLPGGDSDLPSPGISFQFDSWWSVERPVRIGREKGVRRVATEVDIQGGLVTSALLTLIVLPTIYDRFGSRAER